MSRLAPREAFDFLKPSDIKKNKVFEDEMDNAHEECCVEGCSMNEIYEYIIFDQYC